MEFSGFYRMAPELNAPFRQVINDYHPHLSDAKIACMFRSGRWKVKDNTQLGKAIIAPQVWRCMTGYELVLVINEAIYCNIEEHEQIAMLDHVLCFLREPAQDSSGALTYSTRDHDIREFSDVLKRHNVCFSNIKAIDESGNLQLDMLNAISPEGFDEEPPPFELEVSDGDEDEGIYIEEDVDENAPVDGVVKQRFDFNR